MSLFYCIFRELNESSIGVIKIFDLYSCSSLKFLSKKAIIQILMRFVNIFIKEDFVFEVIFLDTANFIAYIYSFAIRE
jgi:hypothetical protein